MKKQAVLAAVAMFAGAAFALPLENGLAAYYTFDEATPVNHALDATVSGVTLNGSAVSGATGASAKYGCGGCLDLAGGYASLDGSESLAFENGNDFTLVVWMRAPARQGALGDDPVFVGNGNWNSSATPGIVLSMDSNSSKPDGYIVCNYSERDSSSGRQRLNSGAIALGEWAFYAVSHTSDGKFSFWRSKSDGSLELVAENESYGFRLVDSTARKFHLGQDGTGEYQYGFSGQIDEFALWTRGLSSADIARIYANGRDAGTLADLMKPAMTVERSTDIHSNNVKVSFSGIREGDYVLKVAYGASDGGADILGWANLDDVATIHPTDTVYPSSGWYALPYGANYYRFFLMKDAAYQQIEYVENPGTTAGDPSSWAYVETGVMPTKDTTMEAELEFTEVTGWEYIAGCQFSSGGTTHYYDFGAVSTDSKWFLERRISSAYTYPMFGTAATGTRYAIDYCVTNFSYHIAGSDAFVNQAVLNGFDDFPDGTAQISLFRVTGQNNYRPFIGKMYSFTIRESGVAVRDYVPAKRLSDGVIGLYDTVNGDFKASASATAFTGGTGVSGDFTVLSETGRRYLNGDPLTAYWTGGGAAGALDDAANWHCEDHEGNVLSCVPQAFTTILVPSASALFDIPSGSGFTCNYIYIENPVALAGDLDWSGLDAAKKVWIAGPLDLAGHNLDLAAENDITTAAISVTDTVGGGEVRVNVPEGAAATNSELALAGKATLVKKGAGTLVTVKTGQANSGGVKVDCGTLVTTNYINTAVLGATGSRVEIGAGATLRVENGYQGLEAYELVLAGGTLYMYNSVVIDGRSLIGSLTQTANSTIILESTGGNDGKRDTEIAANAVWDLGGHKLTVRLAPGDTDFFMTAGTEIENGRMDFPSIMPSATGGWVHFYGIVATNDVRIVYAMNTVRWQNSASYVQDFDNQIPSTANIGGSTRLFVSGVYRPYPGQAADIAGNVRMLDGSTLYLGGHENVTWSTALGGDRVLEYGIMDAPAGTVTTINVDLGARKPLTESSLAAPGKLVSWSVKPAGVAFEDVAGKYTLVSKDDGLYVMPSGMLLIFK